MTGERAMSILSAQPRLMPTRPGRAMTVKRMYHVHRSFCWLVSPGARPFPRRLRSRDLENEAASDRVRLREPDVDFLGQPEYLAGTASGQGLFHFIEVPVVG